MTLYSIVARKKNSEKHPPRSVAPFLSFFPRNYLSSPPTLLAAEGSKQCAKSIEVCMLIFGGEKTKLVTNPLRTILHKLTVRVLRQELLHIR